MFEQYTDSYNIIFTGDLDDGDELGAVQVQPVKKAKVRHPVYYDFNGKDHEMDEQSENEDNLDDELEDIVMNELSIYFRLYILYIIIW
jgi:hypothetical protein